MKNKKILSCAVLVALLLFVVGWLLFLRPSSTQQDFQEQMQEISGKKWEQTGEFDPEEDEGITFELSLIEKCDAGEWVEVAAPKNDGENKEFSGVVSGTEEDGKTVYFLEEGRRLLFTKPEFGEFFEDRTVSLVAREKGKDLQVLKIRCLEDFDSDETAVPLTEETKDFEQRAMGYLQSSVSSLVKKPGTWEVVSFLWPNEEYVYMEFAAQETTEDFKAGAELSEEEVESFLLLLKVTDKAGEMVTEEIGLLKLDQEDEWIAERGQDLFDEVDEGRLFDFDVDSGSWVKIN